MMYSKVGQYQLRKNTMAKKLSACKNCDRLAESLARIMTDNRYTTVEIAKELRISRQAASERKANIKKT